MSSDFETQIMDAVQKAVVSFLRKGDWLMPSYESRIKVPPELMAEAWKMVDVDAVKKRIAQLIEDRVADHIVNKLAAELATDIKQILSVQERREAVRAVAREHMERICGGWTAK